MGKHGVWARTTLIGACAALIAACGDLTVPGNERRDASAPSPALQSTAVVEGPVTGGIQGRPWESYVPDHSQYSDITQFGYVEEEFFVSGTSDNDVPFKTRMIVRRPTDPAKFSGTVFAEWINVTAGDAETLWPGGHPTLMMEGHAYIGMSIQLVGVANLQAWDPVRYGSLIHPGSSHEFRIMEQCLQAIRDPLGVSPLGGLSPEYVIVAGDSQSASRLTSYVADGYAIRGLIDGWIPGRGGFNDGVTHKVMEEMRTPMLLLLEEDQAERPADSDYFRVLFGAGQSHAPYGYWSYLHAARERDLYQTTVRPIPEDAGGRALNGGTGGMNRSYANLMVRAGIHWINRMVRGYAAGKPDNPPIQPRLQRDANGDLIRNEDGFSIGGVRYPDVEVPIGLNTAETYPLFGIWDPWTAEEIVARYPTREEYLDRIEGAIRDLTPTGMLLPIDADLIRSDAAALPVWDGPEARACYNESWGFPPDPTNPCPP